MRTVIVLMAILFVATVAHAQSSATPTVSDLQVVRHSWTKDRINWEKDPFRTTDTDIYDTRNRVTTERRRATALEERQTREQKAAREKPAAPPRYVFIYRLTVVNAAAKAIKEIDWDYVFKDATTGEELGRREFTSTEKIGPGKRKELSVSIYSPPTQRISVKTLGQNEHDGLIEHVIIVRLLYSDGTTWQIRQ